MEAFVITLFGNEYSERVAQRCIDSANIPIEKWQAVTADESVEELHGLGLRWTWGEGYKGMLHKPYGGDNRARIGCFLSHYLLWYRCSLIGEPMLILEHDAVFIRPFEEFEFESICMINDPARATPHGDWWHDQMVARGAGVWSKTKVFDDSRPDGLAGNSAYVIKPEAADRLIELCWEIGCWPNDAIMCRQLIDLQEHYPFITEVRPERSTIQ